MNEKKLTICFLGSAESVHMLRWAKYFAEKEHEVHLLSWVPASEDYNLGNIKLYLIKKRFPIKVWPFNTLLNLPFVKKQVQKAIKEIKPDVVNAHYITSYGGLSVLAGFHPLVMTAWGSDILITPKKFLPSKWAVKYFLRKADLITCDAEHMKEAIKKFGVNNSKIKIINFGIDTKKFSPGQKKNELVESLDVKEGRVVISSRSFYPIYNIDTLIKSIPIALNEFPEAKFILIGSGPQEQELKRLAKDLDVEKNIRFLGRIPSNELPEYLRLADIYVSTSLSDGGIASSTAEAMACGLPVIITDVGDNKKWVKHGESGFVIPTKNSEILAEKIIYLLKNENICKKLGQKGRKIIVERNDYYKEMEKMGKIYEKIIKKD